MVPADTIYRTPRRTRRESWRAIAGAAVVLLIVLVLAASRERLIRFAVRSLGLPLRLGYTVHYVVPDGYRGIFTIHENPADGTPPKVLENGEIVYEIPPSGHLETSDITPILTGRKLKASYRSGPMIGIEGEPLEIKLRGVSGIGSDGKMRDLIGTAGQVRNWFATHDDWHRIEPAGGEKSTAP
jgi:hypothetical protein